MPLLAINGVTIPVRLEEIEDQLREFGDIGYAADGTGNSEEIVRKMSVRIPTRLMDPTQYAAVWAAITAPAPVTATGDLPGASTPCMISEVRRTTFRAAGLRRAVEFLLSQA